MATELKIQQHEKQSKRSIRYTFHQKRAKKSKNWEKTTKTKQNNNKTKQKSLTDTITVSLVLLLLLNVFATQHGVTIKKTSILLNIKINLFILLFGNIMLYNKNIMYQY